MPLPRGGAGSEEAPDGGPRRVMSVTTSSEEARAAFLEARRLIEDNRESEALEGLHRAVKLDPEFALALAYVGYYSSGGEGIAELDRAVALSAGLPDAERLFIQLQRAYKRGDSRKASVTVRELLRAAPDEWRASFHLGNQAYEQRDWTLAIAAYRRSMELADLTSTCIGYNNLGYAQAMGEHFDLALLALERCTKLQPHEPNPRDSVGEVALAAGQLDVSEASFQRALQNDARFFYAWEGIAAVRFFRADAPGTAEALARAREVAIIPEDRAEVDVLAAWIFFALDGEPTRALTQLEVMERDAKALKAAGLYDVADASVNRSAILLEAGRAQDALVAAELALSRAAARGLPGVLGNALLRRARMRKLRALVSLGRLDDAEVVLRDLDAAAQTVPAGAEIQSSVHFARGAIAAARGDLKAAKASLSECKLFGLTERTHDPTIKPEDPLCLWELGKVHRRLGETEAAERIEALLGRKYHRDPIAMYVWRKVSAGKKPAGAE